MFFVFLPQPYRDFLLYCVPYFLFFYFHLSTSYFELLIPPSFFFETCLGEEAQRVVPEALPGVKATQRPPGVKATQRLPGVNLIATLQLPGVKATRIEGLPGDKATGVPQQPWVPEGSRKIRAAALGGKFQILTIASAPL